MKVEVFSFLACYGLLFENRTNWLSRNVNNKLPTHGALHPRRKKTSFTPRPKPEITVKKFTQVSRPQHVYTASLLSWYQTRAAALHRNPAAHRHKKALYVPCLTKRRLPTFLPGAVLEVNNSHRQTAVNNGSAGAWLETLRENNVIQPKEINKVTPSTNYSNRIQLQFIFGCTYREHRHEKF